MAPLPKQKQSRGRRGRRRAHDALTLPTLVACTNCGEAHISHAACPHCGYYDGRQVFEIKERKKKH